MANGKGSGRRPAAVPEAHVTSEWTRIFPTRRVGRHEDAVMHEVTVALCNYCGRTGCEHQAATERWIRGEPAYPPPIDPEPESR